MRILLKGGVWKNTEDEILKAAVMKYGKNQWARISSLLVRKSPKQCKQRWYEWLDPSVKKTPWTREEEEKLLHLAKIMPTQWRTIAGCLEGRTASQCLQHYERLLDQAQGKDELDGDDPRRLRPGEIDPNPEVKPALPDPVDFDEDEKEMLQEARARLANTKGKKAKRKAREKTLDEAKRIAALQKRRELKAAGIHVPVPPTGAGNKKRRVKMIDVMAEVPFHKTAPQGFYDTGKEDAREEREMRNPRFTQKTLQKLEGDRQSQLEGQKKRDEAKMKKLKQDNLPAAMAKISKSNDPKAMIDRPSLNLPAPQIANEELEQIAKAAARGGMAADEQGADTGVTASLLPQVEQTPQITPMRTPLAAPGMDTVKRDAQYLAAMSRETQTPLVGGTGPSIHAGEFNAPAARLVTPNVLKTPLVQARTGKVSMQTPLRTPDAASRAGEDASASATKRRRKDDEGAMVSADQSGSSMFASLSSLPAPRNEYQVVLPESLSAQDDADAIQQKDTELVPDAADLLASQRHKRTMVLEQVEKMQSQVLLRGLPRAERPEDGASLTGPYASMVSGLIAYDNAVTPLSAPGRKSKRARPTGERDPSQLPPMEVFTDAEMAAARRELEQDVEAFDQDEFDAAWEAFAGATVHVEGRGHVLRDSFKSRAELATALKAEYEALQAAISSTRSSSAKLEQKLTVLHQGYHKRSDDLYRAIGVAHEGWSQAAIDRVCFQQLLQTETGLSIPHRIAKMEAELATVAEREEELQRAYAEELAASRK